MNKSKTAMHHHHPCLSERSPPAHLSSATPGFQNKQTKNLMRETRRAQLQASLLALHVPTQSTLVSSEAPPFRFLMFRRFTTPPPPPVPPPAAAAALSRCLPVACFF